MHLPECVQHAAGCDPREMKWHVIYPGIHAVVLPLACRRSTAQVMKLHPGTAAPQHAHQGLELTLVLNGAFSDDSGMYAPGDLMIKDSDDDAHKPVACKNQGCVCLSSSTGSMRLTGLLGRFLNPFLR